MHRRIGHYFLMTLFTAGILLSDAALCESAVDKSKLDAIENRFTTTVSDFNGEVYVIVIDDKGNSTEEKIYIMPGESLKVPRGLTPQKGTITWKDVTHYEMMIARENDPYARWFVENLWRDRLNRVLVALENRLKEKYPTNYKNINIRVRDVADAIGIDPALGVLTGEEFVKIPNTWGGRVPNIDLSALERRLSPDYYINNIFPDERPNKSASPFS